jgi:hypothetical protein
MFDVGEILESEEKSSSIKALTDDDSKITRKALNKNKIILHMERESDGSEGNVFVKLKEQFHDQFPVSKKLLASKVVLGMSLGEFKKLDVEKL